MKNELADIKGGRARTWNNFYDMLWTIATVRYVTYPQLKDACGELVWCKKCGTPKIINALVAKGYLNSTSKDVLTATSKTVDFLNTYSDYNTAILKLPQGKGERDTLYNSEILLKLIQQPDFYALFYPNFYQHPSDPQPFLIPDGALVLKRNNSGKGEEQAKLIFLEIEREKGNWQKHLRNKRRKYRIIAQDKETWDKWWRHCCDQLKLKLCPPEEFCFSVLCVGKYKPSTEWSGWSFNN